MAENDVLNTDYKDGLTWVSDRTGQLRYAYKTKGDEPTSSKWLQPLSSYFAGETIKRGQPVSIAIDEDYDYLDSLTDKSTDDHSYLVLTNTNWHSRSLGIALEYAEFGQPVHILPYGKIVYNKTKSTSKEYNPGFTFSDCIGKSVYVKGGYVLDDNDEPVLDANGKKQFIRGELTIKPSESYSSYSKVVHVGFVTDAPLNGNEIYTTLEIQPDGDSRGVIDYNVFEGIFGEKARFSEDDPVRVFAVGSEDDVAFKLDFLYTAPSKSVSIPDKSFIGLTRMDGKSAFIMMNSSIIPSSNSVTDYSDEAFINLAEHYAGGLTDPTSVKIINLNLTDFNQGRFNVEAIQSKIKLALDEAIKFISDGEITTFTSSELNYLQSNESEITGFNVHYTANAFGGYYELHVSSSLSTYFGKSWAVEHGSYYNKGRAVYADIRIPARQNILGIYFSGVYDTDYAIGDRALFIRNGLLRDTNPIFEPGKEYFLGFNGRVVLHNIHEYLNSIVKIGVTSSKYNLIVDCGDTRYYADGDVPIGYMKPSVNGEAEFGFILADGVTRHILDNDTQDLFDRLHSYFSENDLNIINEADGTITFIIPAVTFGNGKSAQVKYTKNGVYKDIPRIAIKRYFGTFENAPATDDDYSGLKLNSSLDVSDLVLWGPIQDGYKAVDLENLDIKLFVALNSTTDGTFVDWHEVPQGYFTYNNSQKFGFRWKLTKANASVQNPYGQYLLSAEIGDGYGIAIEDGTHQAPIPCYGKEYKVFVSKREVWDRQFDIDGLFKNYISQSLVDESNSGVINAVSGAAVIQYLKNHIDVNTIDNMNMNIGTAETDGKLTVYGEELLHGGLKFYDSNDVLSLSYDPITKKITYIEAQKPTTWAANDLIPLSRLATHEAEEVSTAKKVHGLQNGREGNLNAARLDGFKAGTSLITEAFIETADGSFIPYVDTTRTLNLENKVRYNYSDGSAKTVTELANVEYGTAGCKKTFATSSVKALANYEVVSQNVKNSISKSIVSTHFTAAVQSAINAYIALADAGTTSGAEYDAALAALLVFIPDFDISRINELTHDFVFKNATGLAKLAAQSFDVASSIEYKDLVTTGPLHKENDIDGTLDDLSALQAAYELPIYEFKYKNDPDCFKNYLGIITERTSDARNIVPQYIDIKTQADPQSPVVVTRQDNVANGTALTREIFTNDDLHNDRADRMYKYSYTPEQAEAIKEYLKLIVDTSGKAQSIQSSVGLLLKAAKETQERLLKVETSVGGTDAPTIPGERVEQFTTDSINQDPTQLGLNRLVRAICKELFDQADPTNINVVVSYFEVTQSFVNANPSNSYYVKNGDTYSLTTDAAILANKSIKKYMQSTDDVRLGRVDRLDSEVNGEAARTSNGDTLINLAKTEGATYPSVLNPAVQDVRDNDLEDESTDVFRVKQLAVDATVFDPTTGTTNEDFDGLNNAVNRICLKLDALTAAVYGKDNIDSRPQRLDTIRENIEHIIKEVYFDGADGDNEDSYRDLEGSASVPYNKFNSRIDELSKKLYSFTISYADDYQNFSSTDANNRDGLRTFNSKVLKGAALDATAETKTDFTPVLPTNKNDYDTYASFLDILTDTIGKNILPLHNYNSHSADNNDYPDRFMKTISDRIDTIERALDVVSRLLDKTRDFENGIITDDADKVKGFLTGVSNNDATDLAGTYTDADGNNWSYNRNICSLKEFALRLSRWSGLYFSGTSSNVESVNGSAFAALVASDFFDKSAKNLKNQTNLHDILSDVYMRLRAEENRSEFVNTRLGTIYNEDVKSSYTEKTYRVSTASEDADSSIVKYTRTGAAQPYTYTAIAQADVSAGTYYVKDGNIVIDTTYTVSSDVNALLKTVFGKISSEPVTSYNHFENKSIAEETEKFDINDNIISSIIKLSYATPPRIAIDTLDADGSTALNNPGIVANGPSVNAKYYNIDDEDIVAGVNDTENYPISTGHRNNLFSDFLDTTGRPSRFKVIENSIRAIRTFIGMDKLESLESKYGGKFGAFSVENSEDELYTIANFTPSANAINNLLDFVTNSDAFINLRAELGASSVLEGLPGVPSTYNETGDNTVTDATTLYGHIANIESWINANDASDDAVLPRVTKLETKEVALTANVSDILGLDTTTKLDEVSQINTNGNYTPVLTETTTDGKVSLALAKYTLAGVDVATAADDYAAANNNSTLLDTQPKGFSNLAMNLRLKALGGRIYKHELENFKKANIVSTESADKVTESATVSQVYSIKAANAVFQSAAQVEAKIDEHTYDSNIATYTAPTGTATEPGTLAIDELSKGDTNDIVKVSNYQNDLKAIKSKITQSDLYANAVADAALESAKSHANELLTTEELTKLTAENVLTLSTSVAEANKGKVQKIDNLLADLKRIVSYVNTANTNQNNVINKKAKLETEYVVDDLRTIMNELLAFQNVFMGTDEDSPIVHASALTTAFDVSMYNNSGNMQEPTVGSNGPAVSTLKSTVPSFYDVVAMNVALYNMILNHEHSWDSELNRVKLVSENAEAVSTLKRTITPALCTTQKQTDKTINISEMTAE